MKKKFYTALSVLAVFLGVLIMGCFGDEPLSQDVKDALAATCPDVPPADNIYIGLCGLGFPKEDDLAAACQKHLKAAAKNQAASLRPSGDSKFSYANPCFKEGAENCLNQILEDEALVEADIQNNKELLARYQAVQNMASYANCSSPWEASPPFILAIDSSKLIGTKALLDIKKGNLAAGLEAFEKELAFYRAIIQSGNADMLDLMIAAAGVTINLESISRVIADPEVDLGGYEDRLRQMVDFNFDYAQIMEAALKKEKKNLLVMVDVDSKVSWYDSNKDKRLSVGQKTLFQFGPLLFKKNITSNQLAFKINQDAELIKKAPLSNFPAYYAAQEAIGQAEGIESPLSVKSLYDRNGLFFYRNYIGDAILSAYPGYMPYAARLIEIIVHSHLVRAQLELRLMPDRKVREEEALAQFGPETYNPYTGKHFEWDQEAQTLWAPKVANPEKRLEVIVPSARP